MSKVVRRGGAVAIAVLLSSFVLQAQADRFEKRIPFQLDRSQSLDATVGPVKVTTVKLTDLGRGYGRGGLSLKAAANPSELSTTIRFAFDVNNPQSTDWQLVFTVELLDRDGKVIDRATHKQNFDGEAKVFNVDHPLLEYVTPLVSQVRITIQGRID